MKCDFHTHSTASDGSLEPAALVEHALDAGVEALALTDHDTVDGIAEARATGRAHGVELIAGVELSISEQSGRRQMHLLGLGIDAGSPALLESLDERRAARARRLEHMLDGLSAAGLRLDAEDLRRRARGASVGRPHLAQALVAAGVCSDVEEAFARWLRRGRPGFVPHEDWTAREAIECVHAAGGVAVLAHPPFSVGVDEPGGLDAFVERLQHAGLDGVEVWHPGHGRRQVKRIARVARERGLLATGGSDFHGDSRPDVRIAHGRGNVRVGRAVHRALHAAIARRRESVLAAARPVAV